MSSDMPHPSTPEGQQAMTQKINETAAKFRLASLASAIKEVRKRGGRWKEPADAIEWAHDEIQRLTAELAERPNPDDYTLCDCCGSYATSTADDDGEGNPLGHVQCAQCSRIAELEAALRSADEEMKAIDDDAMCDHDVGICWCTWLDAREVMRKALSTEHGE